MLEEFGRLWSRRQKTFICFLGIYNVKIFTSLKVMLISL